MSQARKKKAELAHLQSKSSSAPNTKQPKLQRPDIDPIYPFPISEGEIPSELHLHIADMEREPLEHQATLSSTRDKYEELISNLASSMDERGVSAEEIGDLLSKMKYSPPAEN